jgi:hypothetical protein
MRGGRRAAASDKRRKRERVALRSENVDEDADVTKPERIEGEFRKAE